MAPAGKSKASLSRLLEQTPSTIPDEGLDEYVTKLILQQAKAQKHQDEAGPSKAPPTNKHFLASVIRNVEGHNSALLRQQTVEAHVRIRTHRKRAESSAKRASLAESRKTSNFRRALDREDDATYSSKMDKYFSKDYDPALDISVDDVTDATTGLIAAEVGPSSSAAWDRIVTTTTSPQEADAKKAGREAKRLRKVERDRIRALRQARRHTRDKQRHREDHSSSPPNRKSTKTPLHSPTRNSNTVLETHTQNETRTDRPRIAPSMQAREWDLGKNLSF